MSTPAARSSPPWPPCRGAHGWCSARRSRSPPPPFRLVLGKALALAAATLPVMLATVLTTFLAAQAILSTGDVSVSLTAPGVARAVVGAALYLTGITLLGAGFG